MSVRETAATSADRLLEWRREFPTLEHTLHFISHSLGAMPAAVETSLADYARLWRERGIRAWEERWFELPMQVGDLLAGLVGVEKGSVSVHPNVTLAQAVALSTVDFVPPRNRLVCTAEDFPSVLYLYEGLARRGAEIVRVPGGSGHTVREEDVLSAMDERTAVVAISSVLFRSSQVLDLGPIARRAREVGARTLVDAYQMVGTVPLDVQALGLDMVTGGSVKWLCGGPGVGYLYVSPRIAPPPEPAITGWFAHRSPFDFDAGPMERDPGARRFLTGTPSIPALMAARPGFEIVARVGVAAIREKSLRQTARMIEWADELGLPLGSPREAPRRGGTVVLEVPHAGEVCASLLAGDVLLDFRPGVGLRLAPHFYTTDEEIDRVMEKVRDEVRRHG